PRLHRHRVDRDERAIVRQVAHHAFSSLLGFAPACVTRGLDPRVHLLRKKMDRTATRACPSCAVLCAASRVNPTCGVKPGDDDGTAGGDGGPTSLPPAPPPPPPPPPAP